jgi:multiple sugar transport system permease protein
VFIGAAAVVTFTAFPLVYMLALSLAPDPVGGGVWPPRVSTVNYRTLSMPIFGFFPALRRTVLLCTVTTAASLLIAGPAAYALARLPIRGRERILAAMLALAFFPGIVLLVPLRDVFHRLDLLDRLAGIGLAQLSFTVPLAVWFLTYAFRQVPEDVEDAARIDGAGVRQRLLLVVLPIARPGVAASTAVVFLASWSDYLFASGLSLTPRSETLSVLLTKLPPLGFLGGQMAAGVLMCLPVAGVLSALLVWLSRANDGSRAPRRRRRV